MSTIFANWKTSLVGILVAALYAATQAYTTGMTLKQWALAAGIVLWGLVQKDFNTTGGTVPATREAQARTTAAAIQPPSKG
jgi:hypothetical protein